MRNAKARLSVCELSTYRWSFEEDVQQYLARGYQAMGIWRAKVSDFGEEKAAELLRETGIQASSLHWAGGFTGSDGRPFRDAMHDALEAIELANLLGAKTLVVLAGSRSGHTRNHARRLLTTALRELAEAASTCNVQLALEPMHCGCAYDWTFLTDIPQTLDIVASIGAQNLGIVFDSYHLAQDENVMEWLPSIVPYVRLVQLGDAKGAPVGEQNRCLLGRGRVPIQSIVSTFESIGYDGFYEVELFGEEIEHLEYGDVLDDCRSTLAALLSAE